MCGIVAFVGTTPDAGFLEQLAHNAGRRGPHGHGWAWIESDRWSWSGGPGRLSGPPSAPLILGQSRLASSGLAGDRPSPTDLQPVICGRRAVIHNGTVRPLLAEGRSDTVALAVVASRDVAAAFNLLAAHPPQVAVVACICGALVAGRWGRLPLFKAERPEGTYLGSQTVPGETFTLLSGRTVIRPCTCLEGSI